MTRALAWVAALAVLGCVAGCPQPSYLACGDLVCPDDQVCDAAHARCVTAEEAAACLGVADGTACANGMLSGYCVRGLCQAAACGDGVVEPGETCDDGNTADGDRCSATCTSDEQCGNGIVDTGETCDDGNLMSRDGCDSTCHVEALTWDVIPLGPVFANAGHTAFDATLGVTLFSDVDFTWGWNGETWSLLASSGPAGSTKAIVSDPLGVFAVSVDGLAAWTGSGWTSAPSPGTDPGGIHVASRRGNVFVFTETTLASLDLATATWTNLPPPPPPPSLVPFMAATFDESRGVLVAYLEDDDTGIGLVEEWDGSAWSAVASALIPKGASLAYDPVLRLVIALGPGTEVWSWDGDAWQQLAESTPVTVNGLTSCDVVTDTARGRLVALCAGDDGLDVVERAADLMWSPGPPFPRAPADVVYDDGAQQLVVRSGTSLFADVGGGWRYETETPGDNSAPIAYDPIRGAIMWFSPSPGPSGTGLYRLGSDGTWTSLLDSPFLNDGVPSRMNQVLRFDPSERRLVYVGPLCRGAIASDTDDATQLAVIQFPQSGASVDMAFDAADGGETLIEKQFGAAYVLHGATWSSSLTPGPGYFATADARRGTVVFHALTGTTFERRGETWVEQPPLPLPVQGPGTYIPSTGQLVIGGVVGDSALLLARSWQSSAPIETCSDGLDDDGDGLVGCADPDCWWACTPACPPYATCVAATAAGSP